MRKLVNYKWGWALWNLVKSTIIVIPNLSKAIWVQNTESENPDFFKLNPDRTWFEKNEFRCGFGNDNCVFGSGSGTTKPRPGNCHSYFHTKNMSSWENCLFLLSDLNKHNKKIEKLKLKRQIYFYPIIMKYLNLSYYKHKSIAMHQI